MRGLVSTLECNNEPMASHSQPSQRFSGRTLTLPSRIGKAIFAIRKLGI